MPQSNVEIVKAAMAAWADRDAETLAATHDPAIEWRTAEDEPDAGTYRGLEAVARLLRDWTQTFEDVRAVPLELTDAGDRVVVSYEMRGKVRGSTDEVVVGETQVYELRAGKIVAVSEYRTRDEALRALGLSE
jgi:ketosteroid isomerase-like protein